MSPERLVLKSLQMPDEEVKMFDKAHKNFSYSVTEYLVYVRQPCTPVGFLVVYFF